MTSKKKLNLNQELTKHQPHYYSSSKPTIFNDCFHSSSSAC